MAIPDFQTIMLPLLKFYSDELEHSVHEALDYLSIKFGLSEEELNELLPSGNQTTFYNRVGWARTYLAKSGLLHMPRRSFYKITERGKGVIDRDPQKIDMKFLQQFPEYVEFRETKKKTGSGLQKTNFFNE